MLEAGLAPSDAAAMSVPQWWSLFIQPPAERRTPTDAATIADRINARRAKLGLPPMKPRAVDRG